MTAPPPQDWLDFRCRREMELAEPYGWLTITCFHWLPERPGALPGLPGVWSVDRADAVVEGFPGEGPARCTVAETGRVPWLRREGREIELLRRGGRLAIRERTATSPAREAFAGVPTYPYDPAWVVKTRFTPEADPERRVDVATHRTDLRQRIRVLGVVDFEVAGEPQRLTVTTIKYGPGIEFHDPTNGTETPAWRQLKITAPDADGRLTLDFNRAIDMWFAFTDHATCPAPTDDNTVTVPVRAGERSPVLG